MNTRSTRSTVKFFLPFSLRGRSEVLPAGDYEIVIEEELLQDTNFVEYRKTATYLIVAHNGRPETRQISGKDLESILSRDKAANDDRQNSEATPLASEDLK